MQQDVSAPGRTNEIHQHSSREKTGRTRRMVRGSLIFLGLGAAVLTSACTPEQIAFVSNATAPYNDVLQSDALHRLRVCESGDNYSAVNPSGTYRGAYQFDQRTWNGVAERHFSWLVGIDPAAAAPWWQDAMARALWSERGRQPWPVCGLRA